MRITKEQFLVDIINKEFELAQTNLHFDTLEELVEYSKAEPEWYSKYSFLNDAIYNEWKQYIRLHAKNIKGRYSAKLTNEELGYICLQYGFPVKE